jgi:predicted ATP-grasp superfamily ATP-dependent carboligase
VRAGPGSTAQATTASGALVLGSDYRALGVVRSLGRRGIPIVVLAHGDDALACRSRYATRSVWLPEDEAEHIPFLLALVERDGLDGWVLVPTADESAALVARHAHELGERLVLTTPAWDTFRWAYDKRLTYRFADSLGVATPRTWYPRVGSDPAELGVSFPAILKPAVKTGFNRLTAAKAWRVDDVQELRARYAEAATLVDPRLLMVQELIPGDGDGQLSYAALCAEGEPLATVVARRTRQYPPDFGRASTYVESIDSDELRDPSERLLRELRYDGLVELEFKRDPRDRRAKLLDVNPRVWGWHTLCASAGVDFPYLAWRLARGEPVAPARGRPGVRWVRLTTDLPTSLKQILRRRLSARAYVMSLRGANGAIFQRDDPLPGLLEVPLLARTLVARLARGDGV